MRKPHLHVHQLLEWADAYRERTGEWPNLDSGRVDEDPQEKWLNIDQDLHKGLRGLPGGWSLVKLLAEFRGKRNPAALPRHTEIKILAWADAHHDRTGRWPTFASGPIVEAAGETWFAVDMALHAGIRGLPGGSSLAKLLRQERRVRRRRKRRVRREKVAKAVARRFAAATIDASLDAPVRQRANPAWARRRARRSRFDRPPLTVDMIVVWADAHHDRTGEWPTRASGRVIDAPDETWVAVDLALHRGMRGLPPGSSLPQLLAEKRGARNAGGLPPLTEQQILAWAQAHFERTGLWPTNESGTIPDTPGETWLSVDHALRFGTRGLRPGTLARLLGAHCGVFHRPRRPQLAIEEILRWADLYHERHGKWPNVASGAIPEAPRETWGGVQAALRDGERGLPAGLSLAKVFSEHRGVRTRVALNTYREEEILVWADAYHALHGRWPSRDSGPIDDAPGETWCAVDVALKNGKRGLPRGSSLARLLAKKRGRLNRLDRTTLTEEQILVRADLHIARTGDWPGASSGPIPEAPGETWCAIDDALRVGRRGLAGRSSLAGLLDAQRGTNRARPQALSTSKRFFAGPSRTSLGTAPGRGARRDGFSGEAGRTWHAVDVALRAGTHGLPPGSSLARLLREQRGVGRMRHERLLTEAQIVEWAHAHFSQHGHWPHCKSGPIDGAPGHTWAAVNESLRSGHRGLPSGSSLAKLLAAYRRGTAAPQSDCESPTAECGFEELRILS